MLLAETRSLALLEVTRLRRFILQNYLPAKYFSSKILR